MDNMGEAMELEAGMWPADRPVGDHFSVYRSLPAMLDILEELDVRATYFIEAWNTDRYPDAIRDVASRGHEIAFHGFRHEPWAALDHRREAALVADSVKRFQDLGFRVRGFRPPGGGVTPGSRDILEEHGITYISPAGEHVVAERQQVILPFQWKYIDAFCYFEPLEDMRRSSGYPPGLLGPEQFEEIIDSCIAEIVETGGYAALLFHPYLHDDPERLAAMRRIVERIADDPRLWRAPCADVAEHVRERPHLFAAEAGLTSQSWMR